jgi:D-beta-D-heptose 7-phosphate kinase/D-beta-D-heptose 1-phosphate adenosyltransferase
MEEKRLMSKYRTPLVCVSGGFDPIHAGHVRYIKHAAMYGDLVVILNSDDWLKRKKGFVFMKYEERAEIIRAISGVKTVVPVDDADGTVCKALKDIMPDYFAKGGDRTKENTPEQELCEGLGITMLWEIGGDDKVQASSRLVDKAVQAKLANAGIA